MKTKLKVISTILVLILLFNLVLPTLIVTAGSPADNYYYGDIELGGNIVAIEDLNIILLQQHIMMEILL